MVKEIPLARRDFGTLVDDEDYDLYNAYLGKRWYFGSKGYATMIHYSTECKGERKQYFLHRLINNTPDDMITDHINGNRIDNRRCNLRSVDRSGNILNGKKFTSNTAGYRVVYFRRGWFVPRICINGKRYTLGSYKTAEEARDKRLEFVKEMGVVVLE